MTGEVRVYVEGGGDGKDTRSAIRRGFGEFLGELRDAARQRRTRWRIVACGARSSALDDFLTGVGANPDAFNVLLVDAEGPITGSPRHHVASADARATEAEVDQIHLMVQMMEAWLVADVAALERFYGKGFRAKAIPEREDVEAIGKDELERALRQATRETQKGEYQKIRHGAKLLAEVDPSTVRGKAPHCDRLFTILAAKIAG